MPLERLKFSIVIPVYNGEKFLSETLDSFLNQTYRHFELILVDDGSTDNSGYILEVYKNKDPRVKVFKKINGGTAPKAIKFGLGYTTGEYFMYSSQDDLISPDFLEKAAERIEQTGADAVVPDMLYYPIQKPEPDGIIGISGDRSNIISGKDASALSLDFSISGFTIWRLSLVLKVGYYDFNINSDEYTVRLLYYNCRKVAFFDGIFYYRQNNPEAITKKWNIRFLEFLDTYKKLEQFAVDAKFTETEIKLVRRMILRSLLNTNRLFLSAAESLPKEKRRSDRNKIKEAYLANLPLMRSLKSNSFKEALINFIITRNFLFFNGYSKVSSFLMKVF
jgi:glycosyltransferase involved in cell wall biosynthesis